MNQYSQDLLYLDTRRRARIERDLNILPYELRKDIGWPDRFSDRDLHSS